MTAVSPIRLTRESVLALGPCRDWREGGIDQYLAGRESVPLDEVLFDVDRRRISEAEQRWLAVRLLFGRSGSLTRWLEGTAERALRRLRGRSGRPEWEEWGARWLSGEDRSKEAAARVEREAAEAEAEEVEAAAMVAREAAEEVDAKAAETWDAWAWASRTDAARAAGLAEVAEEHRLQMQDAIRLLGGA